MSDPLGQLQRRAASKIEGTRAMNKMTEDKGGRRRHMKHKVNRHSRMSKR